MDRVLVGSVAGGEVDRMLVGSAAGGMWTECW